MGFTEKHHAYISALFYKELKEANLPNYRQVFIYATQKAAEQRGSRMAQRALRDGIEVLDYSAYRYYGEWAFTEDYLKSIEGKPQIEPIESETDFAYTVHNCPWAEVYHELDLARDGGVDYCHDLDASIVRGFNPKLEFKITQTLQESDKCVQYQINGRGESQNSFGQKDPKNIKGFDYECGHVYKAFSDVMRSIYKTEGVLISARVLQAFREKFGSEMADIIVYHLDTNFSMI